MNRRRSAPTNPPYETAAYRKRRHSYSAAMSDENSFDDDDKGEEERSYSHHDGATRCCRQREYSVQKTSSLESETRWSTESLLLKRPLTGESSGDIAKSWSEIEIPELLLAHPEILSRMMRCRCFVAQFSACRCAQCQYQRRKISSTSSCLTRESVSNDAKRKDSGNSVSTCQSFLPPSSGRNSAGSLYHYYADVSDNGTTAIQRRHSIAVGSIPHHRYSEQTHSLHGRKIGRADNRRLSEQPLVGDTIGNYEGTTGAASAAKPIVASETDPRACLRATIRAAQSAGRFRKNSATAATKVPRKNGSQIADKSLENDGAKANVAFNGRKSSAIPITPMMMKRRFSEQLILEGGLGSVGESEDLVDRPGNAENEENESLTALNAWKKITLRKHYYPEGDWGYVIVVITILVHLVCHGLQLASGLLMSPAMTRFGQTVENAGTKTSLIVVI